MNKNLTEGALPISKEAYKEIYDFISDSSKVKNPPKSTTISFSFERLINLPFSEENVIGGYLFYLFHIAKGNYGQEHLKKFGENLKIQGEKLNRQVIDQVKKFKIPFYITNKDDSGSFGFNKDLKRAEINVSIYDYMGDRLKGKNADVSFKKVISHELRHLSQFINSIILYYAKEYSKNKQNIENIRIMPQKDLTVANPEMRIYGHGKKKTRTGWSQNEMYEMCYNACLIQTEKLDGSSDRENEIIRCYTDCKKTFKRFYWSSTEEFETHLADFVDVYIDEWLNLKQRALGGKSIIDEYREDGVSNETIANKETKYLTNPESDRYIETIQGFLDYNYLDFIKALRYYRKREFITRLNRELISKLNSLDKKKNESIFRNKLELLIIKELKRYQ